MHKGSANGSDENQSEIETNNNVEQSVFLGGLNLPKPILQAISSLGYTKPTPIQEQSIPQILLGKDIISLAETGSGKTAAYLIPTLVQLIEDSKKQVLILAPTRELATQIGDSIRELTRFIPSMKYAVLIGGAPMFKQIRNLQRHPQLVVATPGRLMDHFRQKTMLLSNISNLVLDEADRMFDMGFAPQVNEIIKHIRKERQTLLFSATFPNEIRDLANRVLRSPIEVEVRKNKLPPKVIDQKMIETQQSGKNEKTLDLINAAKGSVIIFTRTKSRTDRLARYLEEYGVSVTRIHGDRSQGQRNHSINGFKSGTYRVMVATDIAARGLDVASVTDVINYDIPMNSEDYVHRIGRTGRAGQRGQALTLVSPEEARDWASIARKMGLLSSDRGGDNGRNGRHNGGGRGDGKKFNKSHSRSKSRHAGERDDLFAGRRRDIKESPLSGRRGENRSDFRNDIRNNESRSEGGKPRPFKGRSRPNNFRSGRNHESSSRQARW